MIMPFLAVIITIFIPLLLFLMVAGVAFSIGSVLEQVGLIQPQ